jgi:mRNA-degrading endonuclease RelE of RelBE toxin-antitoxin system
MKYELRIPRRAAKQLASLPARARERIVERIERLASWPDHGQDVKALKGQWAGCYRLRCGSYRVLFQWWTTQRSSSSSKSASEVPSTSRGPGTPPDTG